MVKLRPGFAFTEDNQYLALTGEIWVVFRDIFTEKWPRYIESALYSDRRLNIPIDNAEGPLKFECHRFRKSVASIGMELQNIELIHNLWYKRSVSWRLDVRSFILTSCRIMKHSPKRCRCLVHQEQLLEIMVYILHQKLVTYSLITSHRNNVTFGFIVFCGTYVSITSTLFSNNNT